MQRSEPQSEQSRISTLASGPSSHRGTLTDQPVTRRPAGYGLGAVTVCRDQPEFAVSRYPGLPPTVCAVTAGLRRWLLLDGRELARADRVLVVGLRLALGAAMLVAAVLVVLPFVVSEEALDRWAAVAGGLALSALFLVLPMWATPCVIWPKQTARANGQVLTIYTLTACLSLEVRRVDRVWIRTFVGKGSVAVTAGLSGPDIPSAWLSWDGNRHDDPMRLIVEDVVARDGVHVSPRARAALGLPGAPGKAAQFGYGLASICWFFGYWLVMVAAIIAYINVLSGLPVWTR